MILVRPFGLARSENVKPQLVRPNSRRVLPVLCDRQLALLRRARRAEECMRWPDGRQGKKSNHARVHIERRAFVRLHSQNRIAPDEARALDTPPPARTPTASRASWPAGPPTARR